MEDNKASITRNINECSMSQQRRPKNAVRAVSRLTHVVYAIRGLKIKSSYDTQAL